MINDLKYYIKLIISLTFILTIVLLIINVIEHPLKQLINEREGFSPNLLSSGEYPSSVNNPLLDSYKLLDLPGVSTFNSRNSYETYPVFSASSPKINNIRDWSNPDNGKCSTLDFCKGIYKDTMQQIREKLVIPGWNNRVNFYNSACRQFRL
jgi:hypothetical protein